MSKKTVFAVSDIHGSYEKLERVLKYWNPDREQLVFLGDYVDRGPDSLKVLKKVFELREKCDAIVLGGNHEDLLLNALDYPETESSFYVSQGGEPTIKSFMEDMGMRLSKNNGLINENGEPLNLSLQGFLKKIKNDYNDLVESVRNLPDYYEWGHYVFVHAGVDLRLNDWKQTKKQDFRWIREEFHYGQNNTGKTFVFGHTPTPLLNKDKSHNVWTSSCGTKICIDGGAVFSNGLLLGVKITESGIKEVVSIS